MSLRMSRRRLVKGSALLLLGSAKNSAASLPQSPTVEMLQLRRVHLVTESEKLDRRWLEARAKMPWYYLPGPKFLNEHSEPYGPRVGWPDALSDSIQLQNGQLLARPSPHDLRELFNHDIEAHGSGVAIAHYRVRSRQLRNRLQDRRRCQSDLGMPRTSDWEPLDAEIQAIDELIAAGDQVRFE